MFGTTLSREYEIAAGLLGLDEDGVLDLALAAVDAAFLDDVAKASLRAEITAAGR
jgi:aminodeoxyfutalosine deaminase